MAIRQFTAVPKVQKNKGSLFNSLLIAKNRETRAAENRPLRKRSKPAVLHGKNRPQIKNLKITA